jgi:hypothetical protein
MNVIHAWKSELQGNVGTHATHPAGLLMLDEPSLGMAAGGVSEQPDAEFFGLIAGTGEGCESIYMCNTGTLVCNTFDKQGQGLS